MPVPLSSLAFGVVAPAVVCGGVLILSHKLRGTTARRYAVAIAFTAGFLAAYVCFKWAPLTPSEHWHWLPCLTLVAMVLGPVAQADGLDRWERWALYLILAALTAQFLVPHWKTIQPTRHWHLLVLGLGVFSSCVTLEALAKRLPGTTVSAALLLTAAAGAVVLVQSGNMKFTQLIVAAAASMLGCLLSSLLKRHRPMLQSAIPAFAVVLIGLMYVGFAHSFSRVPTASYVLIGIAPMALWLGIGPLAKLPGLRGAATRALPGLILLAVALALALIAEPPWR